MGNPLGGRSSLYRSPLDRVRTRICTFALEPAPRARTSIHAVAPHGRWRPREAVPIRTGQKQMAKHQRGGGRAFFAASLPRLPGETSRAPQRTHTTHAFKWTSSAVNNRRDIRLGSSGLKGRNLVYRPGFRHARRGIAVLVGDQPRCTTRDVPQANVITARAPRHCELRVNPSLFVLSEGARRPSTHERACIGSETPTHRIMKNRSSTPSAG